LIRLWDVVKRAPAGQLAGRKGAVWEIAFSPDGTQLVYGAADRTATLVNLANGRELFALNNRKGIFGSLAFSSDGRTLAAGGGEQQIRLIDAQTGRQTAELQGHLKFMNGLAFGPAGRTLLSASADGTVRVWDTTPQPKPATVQPLPRDVSLAWSSYGPALCLSPDARFLIAIHTNRTFALWDTLKLTAGDRHPLPLTNTTIAAAATGGRQAAFGNESGEVALWDAPSGQSKTLAQPGRQELNRMAFSQDGRRLAAGGGGEIRVFDLASQRETHALSTGDEYPMCLVFSQDGETLLAGFYSGAVKLWRLSEPSKLLTLLGHAQQVRGLSLSPDGLTLVSAATDETVRIWDVPQRTQKATLIPRPALFLSCALSPDGRRLAVGGSDGLVTLWDTSSLQEVATLKGHAEEVHHLAFTPDGNDLISVSADQIRVWHASPTDERSGKGKQGYGSNPESLE
jgi:WD40 repeat protein